MSTSYSTIPGNMDCSPQNAIITRLQRRVKWLERALLQAHYNATHDELTGLLNRSLFTDRLEHAVTQARRQHRQVGLLFLDLDGFKQINDRLGHQHGDELLQQVAHRLVGCTRDADTVGRFGGDEFMVLIPEVDGKRGTSSLARKLKQCLGESYLVGGEAVVLAVTIGAAIYPDDGVEQEDLIRCADTAMYTAKTGSFSMQLLQDASA